MVDGAKKQQQKRGRRERGRDAAAHHGAVGCPSRSYYAGARAACLVEVPDASHCPDEFPTWTEDGVDEPDCALAVVGAGAGGLYAAWRLVEAGTYAASDVCVFEATERVGGRTCSRPLRRARPGGGRGRLPHLARVHARDARAHRRKSSV